MRACAAVLVVEDDDDDNGAVAIRERSSRRRGRPALSWSMKKASGCRACISEVA